jgi:hypothetical protein
MKYFPVESASVLILPTLWDRSGDQFGKKYYGTMVDTCASGEMFGKPEEFTE